MKKLIILLLFVISSFKGLGQNICLKIDSLKVYYVPLMLKTTLTIGEADLRNFDPRFLKIKIITHDSIIKKFSEIELQKLEFLLPKNRDIDCRILIDIHTGKTYLTLAFNNHLIYSFENLSYSRNKELIKWINEFIFQTE